VLHEGPGASKAQRGNLDVTAVVAAGGTLLTICGHVHWPEPLAEVAQGVQVLNVDGRALVLTV